MIKGVEKGIYIIGDGSFSIDQQRYNFQFGGQLYYEIKNGKIAGMLKDVPTNPTHRNSGTPVLEIAMKVITVWVDHSLMEKASRCKPVLFLTVRLPARFNGVNVINTARKMDNIWLY